MNITPKNVYSVLKYAVRLSDAKITSWSMQVELNFLYSIYRFVEPASCYSNKLYNEMESLYEERVEQQYLIEAARHNLQHALWVLKTPLRKQASPFVNRQFPAARKNK